MQIGIFGGTFNPIHLGHLRVAEEIRHRFKMREIIFVPSANPPHKDTRDIVDPLHRLKMVNLAITGNSGFSVSDVELRRQGKSYSVDTIRELQAAHPEAELTFIMGLDAFLEMKTWHRYSEIFGLCDILVTSRPGTKKVSLGQALPQEIRGAFKRTRQFSGFYHHSGHKLIFTEVTHLGISGSMLREMIRSGESIRYLLPRRVMEYILENQLYVTKAVSESR